MKTPKILKDINQDSIGYLESSTNYTLLFLQNGKSIISGYNIKVFEEIFANVDFIKINRSKIVNIAFIRKTLLNNRVYTVHLVNGEEINISRRRVNKLKQNYPLMF